MACFVVPTAEAIVTTIAKKHIDKKSGESSEIKNPFVKRMGWLNNMLWGGSALLAFEHIWHGEIVPVFPFLTNAMTPVGAVDMLREMATSGVAMAALVTAVWAGIVMITNSIEKKPVEVKNAFRG
ncbi:MAG: hypothetical protein J1G06_09960 [Oscillospiraceae bacterium]|nr:hypothetical protein [Oscillospiraceae bacterium]